MLAMTAEDLAILERLAEEHPDPAVRRALRAALDELRDRPRVTWGYLRPERREVADEIPPEWRR